LIKIQSNFFTDEFTKRFDKAKTGQVTIRAALPTNPTVVNNPPAANPTANPTINTAPAVGNNNPIPNNNPSSTPNNPNPYPDDYTD